MVDIVELKAQGSKHMWSGGGTVVSVQMIKADPSKGTMSPKELDVIRFDMEDRKAGKPEKIVAAVNKAMAGDYEKHGCEKLGFVWSGNACTDKPIKQQAKKQVPSAKKEVATKQPALKTTIVKRKK